MNSFDKRYGHVFDAIVPETESDYFTFTDAEIEAHHNLFKRQSKRQFTYLHPFQIDETMKLVVGGR